MGPKGKSKGKGKAETNPAGKGRGSSKGKGKGKGKGKAEATPRVERYASDTPGYVWVAKSFRKKSLFATQSFEDSCNLSSFPGARLAELRTCSSLLGILECIIVEPAGKALVGAEAFATTGVIICLHGMPPSPAVLEEWGNAVTAAGWLELSCSVVIPNVQMSASLQLEDFEAIVDAALKLANFDRCVIVGKSWGAQRAVEIATMGKFSGKGKVEGVILVAPSSPAPEMCQELAVPAMVLWARDDEVSAFEDHTAWMEALDDRLAPTTFLQCPSGGHRLDLLMKDHLEQQAVRNFTTAALLCGEMQEDEGMIVRSMSERERRLSGELPLHLQQSSDEEDDESDADAEQDADREDEAVQYQAQRRSIKTMDIMSWMQAGMHTAAE